MLSLITAVALAGLSPQDAPKGRLIVTRQDLAEVVQEVDAALAEGKLLPAKEGSSALAETNLAFDAVTLTFFKMDLAAALGELEVLADQLLGAPYKDERLVVDTQVDGVWVKHPAPWSVQRGSTLRYRVRARQAVPPGAPASATWSAMKTDLDLRAINAIPQFAAIDAAFDEGGRLLPVEFEIVADADMLPAFEVFGTEGASVVPIVPTASGKIEGAPLRQRLVRQIGAVSDPRLDVAARVFRQRLKLRWDAPSQENSTEFSLDPVSYEAELLSEIRQLEAGKDPYLGRPGDHWRTFAHGRRNLPARVYGQPISSDRPLPLVIAFHGAGGDENFMFELAGDGYLKRLADQHQAVVVCPRTPDYMFSKKPFLSLIEGIRASYSIDPDRIFVLGHSMGGMATSGLCRDAPEAITKACCIAGFSDYDYDPSLPIQVISGRLDRIVSFRRVEGAARAARERGGAISFVPLDDQGHTLLLPAAFDLAFGEFFPEAR